MSRSVFTAVLALLVLVGLWPWFGELHMWPMAPDSATWIERAELAPGWSEWTFLTSHFDVGWRPLTALSFTLDRALFALAPLGYRLTDLALHAACAACVALLARRLAPELPPWSGWLTALLFLAHPVADEVVPFLARRSYPLGALLGLGAMLVFLRPGQRGERSAGRCLVAGALLALAIAANEVSVLFAVALPGLALVRSEGTGAASLASVARSTAWLALLPLALVGARFAVVGGVGGYELPEGTEPRTWAVFVAAWRETAGIARGPAALAWPLLALALPYYVGRVLLERGTALVLALWVAAHPLLYAGQGVWFPRQAYVAVVPLALLIALLLARTLATRSTALRCAHLAPQLTLIGALVLCSPLILGPDPDRIAERNARNDLIDAALNELGQASATPGEVRLVLPYTPPEERADALRAKAAQRELSRASRLPARWLATCLAERGSSVSVSEFIYVLADGRNDPLATPTETGVRIRGGSPFYLAVPRADVDGEPRKPRMVRSDGDAEREVDQGGSVWIAPSAPSQR